MDASRRRVYASGMNTRLLQVALASLLTAFSTSGAVRAEILIYDLSFNRTGPAVNAPDLEGGYLLVDENSATVTSLIILNDPVTYLPYYTSGLLTANYMEMIEEGSNTEFAVIYSMSGGSDADNLGFQILGKTSRTEVGGGSSLKIARKLRGYMLTSSAESSTTTDSTTSSTTDTTGSSTTTETSSFSYGFASSSKVTAQLDSGLTKEVNNERLDAAGALKKLETELKNRGIGPEATPSPSPTPAS